VELRGNPHSSIGHACQGCRKCSCGAYPVPTSDVANAVVAKAVQSFYARVAGGLREPLAKSAAASRVRMSAAGLPI
jgi:hypothetical protein